MNGEQLPPKRLLGGLIAAHDTYAPTGARLVQLAAYFQDGRWKKVRDDTFTLRVTRKDPTSDKTNTIGFLIEERDQPGGLVLADMTHATLNGDDLNDTDVLNLVDGLELPPVPPGYPPLPGSEAEAPKMHPPEDLSAFHPGMLYSDARQQLGLLGIKPAAIPRPTGDKSCGVGQEEICRDYPEIIDCTGMGANPCRAAFVNLDGRIAVASTSGDDASTMTLTGIAWANAEDQKRVRNIIAGKEEDAR